MFQLADKTRRLLALFLGADYGDRFSYEEIVERTGCDLADGDRSKVYSVNKILEREHRKSVLNVRGWGYQVALPRQHAESMGMRRRRAGTQIVLAQRTGHATPLDRLSSDDLRTFTDMQVQVARVAQALTYHDQRIARIERQLGIDPEGPPVIDGVAEDEPDT